jgi:serine/tyrosine/threonine adenylyltransferase
MTLFTDRLQQHFYNAFKTDDQLHCSEVVTQGLQEPVLVSSNRLLAEQLGIDSAELSSPEMLQIMSGNQMPQSSQPIALVYSGHQFGVWAGQLGDGRAITLGELAVKTTPSEQLWDIQLKGAGPTPYSRFADGRAVLRSSIREYLCSEAMHGLGIATTRALCLVDSKTPIYREEVESGATVCRVAQSHIRFGSFEHFHYRKQPEAIKNLADYIIQRNFPEWIDAENKYYLMLENCVLKTAKMIAQWQSVGFNHGVMNTDNMSVIGDTIDYGPFGFLDNYDPEHICNHSDSNGRYAFKNQPSVGLWNLNALATSLTSLISNEDLIRALKQYEPEFLKQYRTIMASKIGLEEYQSEDETLINQLLELLQSNTVDYSIFFRSLSQYCEDNQSLRDHFLDRQGFDNWGEKYLQRLQQQATTDQQRQQNMNAVNPKYILRNYMAQTAIEKASQGDYSEVNLMLEILQKPFDEHPQAEHYAGAPPDWAEKISVSCSS